MIVSDLGSGRLSTDVTYVPNGKESIIIQSSLITTITTELGRLDKKPSSWQARYPSGEATMPFMLYHTKKLKKNPFLCDRGFGLFYGVIDPTATQKDLVSFSTFRGKTQELVTVFIDVLGLGFTADLFPENNVVAMTRPIESVHFLIGKSTT